MTIPELFEASLADLSYDEQRSAQTYLLGWLLQSIESGSVTKTSTKAGIARAREQALAKRAV